MAKYVTLHFIEVLSNLHREANVLQKVAVKPHAHHDPITEIDVANLRAKCLLPVRESIGIIGAAVYIAADFDHDPRLGLWCHPHPRAKGVSLVLSLLYIARPNHENVYNNLSDADTPNEHGQIEGSGTYGMAAASDIFFERRELKFAHSDREQAPRIWSASFDQMQLNSSCGENAVHDVPACEFMARRVAFEIIKHRRTHVRVVNAPPLVCVVTAVAAEHVDAIFQRLGDVSSGARFVEILCISTMTKSGNISMGNWIERMWRLEETERGRTDVMIDEHMRWKC